MHTRYDALCCAESCDGTPVLARSCNALERDLGALDVKSCERMVRRFGSEKIQENRRHDAIVRSWGAIIAIERPHDGGRMTRKGCTMTESIEVFTLTATELADAIGVAPKAFRSFVRSNVRLQGGKVGVDTPGSGKRYVFNVTQSEIDAIGAAYASHRRTNGAVAFDAASLGIVASSDDDTDGDAV